MANLKWFIGSLLGAFLLLHVVDTCNEAVCGSIVTKCLLTKSCSCDLVNCTCCKDCSICLNRLYTECCSCLDMCPKSNDTSIDLGKTSIIEMFNEGAPALFKVLTELPDPYDRWESITFPLDIDIGQYQTKTDLKIHIKDSKQEVFPKQNVIMVNCTVAFWSQCLSSLKCKTSCMSMGASSYRWFHDGCCECVDQNCIHFGINESRCTECPPKNDEMEDLDEDDLDYGEEDDYEDI